MHARASLHVTEATGEETETRTMRTNTEVGEEEAGLGQKEGQELPEEAVKETPVRGKERRGGAEGQRQKEGWGWNLCVRVRAQVGCVHTPVFDVCTRMGAPSLFQVL